MRMISIRGTWYHILEEIETPFYKEDTFEPRVEYIILQNDQVKYLRPDQHHFEQSGVTQKDLLEIIKDTESKKWRSEERRLSYLNHFKRVLGIMRDHIIEDVLSKKIEFNYEFC